MLGKKNKTKDNERVLENENANMPYVLAKYEWNERYGIMIRDKRIWQLTALVMCVANIVCVISVIYIAMQSKFVPYVVKVNTQGQPIQIEKVDPTTKIDSAILTYQLAQFIVDVRTVTSDGKLKRIMMERARVYCSQNAFNTLQDYWLKAPPDKIAQLMNISVNIDSILAIKGAESWQVNWTETALQNGLNLGQTKYTAIVNIGKNAATSEIDYLKNPTGLLIKSINWSKSYL